MPRRTYKEFSRAWNALIAKYGITEVLETEPPSTTTFDIIMRRPRAESRDNQRRHNPDSLDDTPCVGPTRWGTTQRSSPTH